MDEAPYEAEEVLQTLLADHPDILAGEQVIPDAPRRWVLVKREHGVPDEPGGSWHWSLDHLSWIRREVPTLVELQRRIHHSRALGLNSVRTAMIATKLDGALPEMEPRLESSSDD